MDDETIDSKNNPTQPKHRGIPVGSKSFHVLPPEEEEEAVEVIADVNQPTQPVTVTPVIAQESPPPPPSKPLDSTPLQINDTSKPKKAKKKREGGVFSLFITIIVAIIFVQIINAFLFQSYRVVGHSMDPTLAEGDFLIISKIGRTFKKITRGDYEPSRGDIIVFKSPRDELQLVKRVIGLPGERVVVEGGTILVYNDEHPDGFDPDAETDYVDNLPITSGNADVTVPDGHLFVSGDNREGGNSLDSRNELGTIPESLVVGNLSLRIFPLSKAKFF